MTCSGCGAPLTPGLGCACQFPRYTCGKCGVTGAARTVMHDQAAYSALITHYRRHHG